MTTYSSPGDSATTGWGSGASGAPVRRWRGVLLVHLERARLREQAGALREAMPEGWRVGAASHHDEAEIRGAIEELVAEGVDELVVIPMYPHADGAATREIVRQVYGVLGDMSPGLNTAVRPRWNDDVGYVSAQASLLAEVASDTRLLPREGQLLLVPSWAEREAGHEREAYLRQLRRSVDLIAGRLGWPRERMSVAFPAKNADDGDQPVDEELERLWGAGTRKVLVCSLDVACDGIAMLGQRASRWRDRFEAEGGQLEGCPPLMAYPSFTSALRNLVLRGHRPLLGRRGSSPLLTAESESPNFEGDTKSLVVIGATVPNSVGPGLGPRLQFSNPGAFGRVRKSRRELREFLDWIRSQPHVQEAFVWNTCQRVEFWGWLTEPDDDSGRACVVAQIREQLYGEEPEGLEVNVLFGSAAWHHAIRTASGLNSSLPGDLDVVAQLQVSCRIAERAGTAGPRANRLVDDVIEISDEVRAETAWGQYSAGYCYAALNRVHAGIPDLADHRHVVIGGSATSRSILATLAEQFHVPKRQMTLVYRDHHGQMRLLRAAIGGGRRLRVNGYGEESVLQAIQAADFVYFGIDHAEPVLDPATIAGLRDYRSRPLTIVDFNSCGSLSAGSLPDGVSLWREEDLDRAVAEFAAETFSREPFSQAIDAAELWIAEHVPKSTLQRLDLPCLGKAHEPRAICQTCWVTP